MPKLFTRALYAAAAATVVASTVGLSAGMASASTTRAQDTASCGTNCISIFSRPLGSGTTLNAYVPGDKGTGGKVGQKVNMHLAINTRPNGDWQPSLSGFVFQFCGLLANDFFSPTSFLCLNHPFFPVIELNWAPFGNQSGLCAGVAKGAVAGESVTLQSCGQTANTVWVGDPNAGTGGPHGACLGPVPSFLLPVGPNDPNINFCPLINGGDTAFSQPLVLTLNTGTQAPQNQLQLERLSLLNHTARGDQLFAYFIDPSTGV
jgi:hypothetical protein